ncbi:MAG TPA: hypothetical protein VMB79_17070 [Jatrophihabitans sp.]|nr:hypothetical protein [Jatrophihabitans sp.]
MDESVLGRLSVAELCSSVRGVRREVIALQYRQRAVLAELESRGVDSVGLRGLPDLIQVELTVTRRVAKGDGPAGGAVRRAAVGDRGTTRTASPCSR